MRRGHALVIEGGGMKAAYANGVLSAFEEAAEPTFDAVYGSSAGGALAAWYAAGQARYAEATWPYAADRRILSYGRFLRGGPLLDHEALLDIVYLREHPIDQEAIRTRATPVIVVATDVATGQAVYQDLRHGDVISWLKATGRLPLASGGPVPIADRLYLDGGIADPIPVRRAIEDGHHHVTLILNTPPEARKRDNPALAALAARKYPALRDGIVRHHVIKHEAITAAAHPPAGVRVDIIQPEVPTGLSRLSRDLGVIQAGIAQGHAAGQRYLESLLQRA